MVRGFRIACGVAGMGGLMYAGWFCCASLAFCMNGIVAGSFHHKPFIKWCTAYKYREGSCMRERRLFRSKRKSGVGGVATSPFPNSVIIPLLLFYFSLALLFFVLLCRLSVLQTRARVCVCTHERVIWMAAGCVFCFRFYAFQSSFVFSFPFFSFSLIAFAIMVFLSPYVVICLQIIIHIVSLFPRMASAIPKSKPVLRMRESHAFFHQFELL